MSKQISNLLQESNATFRAQRNETKALVSKWNSTGLLEGIDAEYDKHNTAILLENQAKQLISEANSTSTTSAEEWNGVALPLVRRIFGELSAKEFVSVQPMNLPSGLVFWLDFKYGSNGLGDANGYKFNDGTDILGDTSSSTTPTGGVYGKGKSGYSAAATKSVAVVTTGVSASWADVGYDGALSASIALGTVLKITLAHGAATFPTDFDIDAVQSVGISSSGDEGNAGFDVADNLAAYNYTQGTNSYFFTTKKAAGTAHGAITDFYYSKTPADNVSRGDFEATDTEPTATDLAIPQIDVALRQEALVAKTRKLKVVWTPEFAQDLNAYHSIDAEAELTSMLSEYISMEIDMEILEMIDSAALHTDTWIAEIGKKAGVDVAVGENYTSSPLANFGNGTAYTQASWFQTLGTKLQKVSNKIHASTMRGGANFVVCSPDVATVLESLTGFGTDTDGLKNQFAMGVQKIGAINNRYTVYKNPYWQDNVLLMGFRGSQFLETGAVYAPYIPLIMTPLVYDPTNFTPRKGVMTRYAKKVVRPEFYGKIKVGQLDTI
tara:strand:+ start:8619 stop:10271 length:1653 start_codon:yes stop_codon:yes gene_type:complete